MRKKEKNIHYSVSYTAGALLFEESEAVINSIDQIGKISSSDLQIDKKLLPTNSETSRKRISTELKKRFVAVKEIEVWEYYRIANEQEKRIILFYALCKAYPILLDFMTEVVLLKWRNLDKELSKEEFLNFIYRKFDSHPELDKYSENTLKKVATRSIRILKEVGIFRNGILERPDYDLPVWNLFNEIGEVWFLEIMFLSEMERKKLLNQL